MTTEPSAEQKDGPEAKIVNEHNTLKYSLLGPSLTKSGQDNVDQSKASYYCEYTALGSY
jgi:DNA polymerase kappa